MHMEVRPWQYWAPGEWAYLRSHWETQDSQTMCCLNKLGLGLCLTIDSFSGITTCTKLCLSVTFTEATNIVWSCWHLVALRNDECRSAKEVRKEGYPYSETDSRNGHESPWRWGEHRASEQPEYLTSTATTKEFKAAYLSEKGITTKFRFYFIHSRHFLPFAYLLICLFVVSGSGGRIQWASQIELNSYVNELFNQLAHICWVPPRGKYNRKG